ncbi:hypothetical protein M569_04645, partial [Genlisea aurea]
LGDLPESCIAQVLSHLEAVEVAGMGRVSSAFHSASTADFIWVPRLPSNCDYILGKLPDRGAGLTNKMEMYAKLCRPIPFDGGTKEVWIEKKTGGVCLAISYKAMNVTGINDRRYWIRLPSEEFRFQTVAYLKQIWWLELKGNIRFRLPSGSYSLFFRLQLCNRSASSSSGRGSSRTCKSDKVHGWDTKPVTLQLRSGDGEKKARDFMLGSSSSGKGKWSYYHVGDFVAVGDEMDVDFSLTQIDCTHTKGGLWVDHVLICPSG